MDSSINDDFIRYLGQKEDRSQLKQRMLLSQELFRNGRSGLEGGGVPISGLMVQWGGGFSRRQETRENCLHLVGLVKCVAKTWSIYKKCRFENNCTMGPIETMQIFKIGVRHGWVGLKKLVCITLKMTGDKLNFILFFSNVRDILFLFQSFYL